jgi:hypothetical protein
MATATTNYSSNANITMELANLGSSATFVAGRESTQISNTTDKYVDVLVSGFVSVGTTPTANTSILVYVYGADTSVATTPLDTNLDGADSALTLTNTGILNALRLGASIAVPSAASDIKYPVLPFSVAALFGGSMPKFWGLYVAHNTGVNLRNNTVNTNSFEYVGIKYDIA